MAAYDELEPQDIEALLATRRELGPSYEKALVESFTQRVEWAISNRRHEVVADRKMAYKERRGARTRQFILGIVSVGSGVGATAILTEAGDMSLASLVIAWGGIVGVNAVHAWSNRR